MPLGAEISTQEEVEFLYSLKIADQDTRRRVKQYHLLYGGSGRLARTFDLDTVFDRLESHLQILVAYGARDCLFVHAGVVGWQGRAIVLPGRSFCGKSDLVTALVRAGATYYSDEYAIFDPEGRVHPYPRPIALRAQDGRPDREVRVEELGGTAGSEPLPVGLVMVTQYESGARWSPRELTPANGLLALMDNTVAARRPPEVSMPILSKVVSSAQSLHSKRGEAVSIALDLLQRLDLT